MPSSLAPTGSWPQGVRMTNNGSHATGCAQDNRDRACNRERMTEGLRFFLSQGPVAFWAKTLTRSVHSTAEAGPMAISFGGKEATYLSSFTMELGFTSTSSVLASCNSTDALHATGNSTYSSRGRNAWLCGSSFIAIRPRAGKSSSRHVPTQVLAD